MSADASNDDLPCRELVELITDYFEQALPSEERRRFEEHLATCPGCQEYLQQMHQTIGAARQVREADIDPLIRARLLAAFRSWNSR